MRLSQKAYKLSRIINCLSSARGLVEPSVSGQVHIIFRMYSKILVLMVTLPGAKRFISSINYPTLPAYIHAI